MELKGLCTITLTPFDEQGRIDEESIRKLTEFYIARGVHGLTILGIMGEVNVGRSSDYTQDDKSSGIG